MPTAGIAFLKTSLRLAASSWAYLQIISRYWLCILLAPLLIPIGLIRPTLRQGHSFCAEQIRALRGGSPRQIHAAGDRRTWITE